MLPTNFDSLINERSDLAPALRRLREWIEGHKYSHTLDPRELAKSLPEVDSISLASALALLVRRGMLRQVYRVVTPTGSLADGEYEDPRKIPPRVPDRFNRYFDTVEAEVVPVLRAAAK